MDAGPSANNQSSGPEWRTIPASVCKVSSIQGNRKFLCDVVQLPLVHMEVEVPVLPDEDGG
jgi:hypothetical protein